MEEFGGEGGGHLWDHAIIGSVKSLNRNHLLMPHRQAKIFIITIMCHPECIFIKKTYSFWKEISINKEICLYRKISILKTITKIQNFTHCYKKVYHENFFITEKIFIVRPISLKLFSSILIDIIQNHFQLFSIIHLNRYLHYEDMFIMKDLFNVKKIVLVKKSVSKLLEKILWQKKIMSPWLESSWWVEGWGHPNMIFGVSLRTRWGGERSP